MADADPSRIPDARLIVYDSESHLEGGAEAIAIGDTFEVIRGNGPHEGERMGTAIVARFDDDGDPVLEVRFGGDS
jgi:hypothetical protein